MDYTEIGKKLMRLNCKRRAMHWRLTECNDMHFGQFPILEYITRHEGCSQREVASVLLVTPASVAASCKRLEQSGLIEREPDRTDRRQNHLFVTEPGKALLAKCKTAFERVDFSCFSCLTEEEQAQFVAIMDKILNRIKEQE